jgi:hypothetical protein
MKGIMSTTTLIVLSDPANGDEALGRVFNALATAQELDRQRAPVQLVFQGAGTRWPALLLDAEHPAHGLFKSVEHRVAGASWGCAAVFDAQHDIERLGVPLLADNAVPGTPGLASIAAYAAAGPVITF